MRLSFTRVYPTVCSQDFRQSRLPWDELAQPNHREFYPVAKSVLFITPLCSLKWICTKRCSSITFCTKNPDFPMFLSIFTSLVSDLTYICLAQLRYRWKAWSANFQIVPSLHSNSLSVKKYEHRNITRRTSLDQSFPVSYFHEFEQLVLSFCARNRQF